MPRFDGGCVCCVDPPTVCGVLPTSPFAIANWSSVSGTWSTTSGVLSGSSDAATIVTNLSTSGAQYFAFNIKSNAADQVVDIMFGCDAAGVPKTYMRMTFGDAADAKPCGSVQFFRNGVALEDATPVLTLREGVQFGVTTCFDAALSKWLVIITGNTGVAFGGFYSASADLPSNPSGRLGLKLVTGNGGSVEFRVRNGTSVDGSAANNAWYNLFLSGDSDCRSCLGCGILLAGWSEPNGTNCVATTSGISTGWGYESVAMNVVVSAHDRARGYGAQSSAVMYCTTADEGRFVMQLGGYEATLHLGPIYGTHPDQTQAVYLEFEGQTTAPVIFGNPGGGVSGPPATYGTAFCEIWMWFCDGEVFATGGAIGNYSEILSVAGEPVAGSSDGASLEGAYNSTYAGVGLFGYVRCYECEQCENCEDVEADRSYEVVIVATPSTYDGTYVVPLTSGSCNGSYDTGSGTLNVNLFRSRLRVSIGFGISGDSDGPVIDCEGVDGLVIALTGSVTGTATVTAL